MKNRELASPLAGQPAPASENKNEGGPENPSLNENERGLERQLTSRQLSMLAIGGAIGTGLFLGSSLAVRTAGPAVIVTYLLGALVALLLMAALTEMAVAHPTAGSFGVYAEIYLSRWAGFVVRYTYWASLAIAIGGEATAVAIYCRWWFPGSPPWMWILGFSGGLMYLNARSVGSFAEFEYWFAMIKVVAIILFIAFGASMIFGFSAAPALGFRNFTGHGGFFSKGIQGAWMAIVFVIFSYIGAEVVAVTAGEAKDPRKALPRAMRTMLARLVIFYIGAMVVLVGVVPWQQVQSSNDVTASPFVKVFQLAGIPAAAHVVNFVVLTAALSSMNCMLYMNTRILFSLACSGFAPAKLANVNQRGCPVGALIASGAGLLVAAGLAFLYPGSAFVYMFGISLFGGLFVWLMIFITHLAFRRKWRSPDGAPLPVRMMGCPYTTLLGAGLLVAILATTWWVEGMRITLIAGIPWLMLISLVYLFWGRLQAPERLTAVSPKESPGSVPKW